MGNLSIIYPITYHSWITSFKDGHLRYEWRTPKKRSWGLLETMVFYFFTLSQIDNFNHTCTYSTKYWVRIYRLNGSILSNLQTSRKRGTTTNGSYFQSICLLCKRFERFKWVIYRKRWITSRFHSKRRFFLGLFLNESEGYFIRKQLEEMFSMWWNKCLYVLEVSRWFLLQVELA